MDQPLENLLKYGDQIIISTAENPPTYLFGRCQNESPYFLQIINNSCPLVQYTNFSECLFMILPKLRYEAIKTLKKSLQQRDLQGDKLDIIKKRVENEIELNENIKQKWFDKPILLGDEVHLVHVISNCFVKCVKESHSTNINQKSQKISQLKLSNDLSSGVVFKIKIDPYYTFKKDGEKISFEDNFYFENIKLKSAITFRNEAQEKLKITNKVIKIPSLMETNIVYDIYEAGHQIKDIVTFKAFKIHTPEQSHNEDQQIEENMIHWGDFVRVKHILRDEKSRQAVLQCQTTVNGWSPYLLMSTRDVSDQLEGESISSIFQLVSDDQQLLGQPIKINQKEEEGPTTIMLRHWITGKFVNISKEQIKKISDDNSLIQMTQSLSEKIQDNKFKFKRIESASLQKQQTLLKQRSSSDKNISLSTYKNEEINKFLEANKIVIEPAQTEDSLLTTKSCFSISEFQKSPEIQQDDKENEPQITFLHVYPQPQDDPEVFHRSQQNPKENNFLSETYFNRSFHQNDGKQFNQKFYKVERSQNQDFFFLEMVKMNEITYMESVLSVLAPFVKLINEPDI